MNKRQAEKMRQEIEKERPAFRGAIERCKAGIQELSRDELEGALLCYMMTSVSDVTAYFLTDEENLMGASAVKKIRARGSQLFNQEQRKKEGG